MGQQEGGHVEAIGAEPFIFYSTAHKTRFLTTSNLQAWLALTLSLLHPGERIIRLT